MNTGGYAYTGASILKAYNSYWPTEDLSLITREYADTVTTGGPSRRFLRGPATNSVLFHSIPIFSDTDGVNVVDSGVTVDGTTLHANGLVVYSSIKADVADIYDITCTTLEVKADSFFTGSTSLGDTTVRSHIYANYPEDDNEAATKKYVDDQIEARLDGLGTGNVTGPESSTDNAVVRFDGTTGTLVQNSGVTISDSGVVTAPTVVLTGVPTLDGHATPKWYVDDRVGGNIVGPNPSTANAVPRFADTTGTTLANSLVTILDDVLNATTVTITGTPSASTDAVTKGWVEANVLSLGNPDDYVSGPDVSTVNAIAVWGDAEGKTLLNSTATIASNTLTVGSVDATDINTTNLTATNITGTTCNIANLTSVDITATNSASIYSLLTPELEVTDTLTVADFIAAAEIYVSYLLVQHTAIANNITVWGDDPDANTYDPAKGGLADVQFLSCRSGAFFGERVYLPYTHAEGGPVAAMEAVTKGYVDARLAELGVPIPTPVPGSNPTPYPPLVIPPDFDPPVV